MFTDESVSRGLWLRDRTTDCGTPNLLTHDQPVAFDDNALLCAAASPHSSLVAGSAS
jgi:hypothetical protein